MEIFKYIVYKRELKEYKHILLIISINNIMQQYIIHLNGGYNPFVRLGRGALGYRPLRKMIGRSKGGMISEDNLGGSEGSPTFNIETLENNMKENYEMFTKTNNREYYNRAQDYERLLDIARKSQSSNVGEPKTDIYDEDDEDDKKEVTVPIRRAKTVKVEDEENKLLKTILKEHKIEKTEEKEEEAKKKAEEEKANAITPLQQAAINLLNKNFKDFDEEIFTLAYINKKDPTKQVTESEIQEKISPVIKNKIINSIIELDKIKNKTDKYHTSLVEIYIKNIDELMETLNKMYKIKQFIAEVIVNKNGKNELNTVTVQTEKILPFEQNIKTQTEAENIIKAYWDPINNERTILSKNDIYDEEINGYIGKINKMYNKMFDKEYDENSEESKKIDKFRKTFPDENKSKAYAETIIVNNKSKFFNSDGTQKTGKNKEGKTYNLYDHEYNSPGKAEEFSICGKNNTIARTLYKINNPNFQVSDFIVEDILKTGAGKYFCADNIDFNNKIINEMKKYTGVNYMKLCNLNIELKKIYYDELINKLRNFIQDYKNETNAKEREKIKEIIKIYNKILTNKDEFDKDFYKNARYIGIGVSMNKFNPIVIPENYNYNDSPSTREMMSHVQKSQGQKFIPTFVNRQITEIECTKAGSVGYEKFNREFNEKLNGKTTPYDFKITCAFSKVIGVYDYTNDKLLSDDFILRVYKCAYAHDDQKGTKFNAVLIPIEKFIIEY